jgi:hypothetical protein
MSERPSYPEFLAGGRRAAHNTKMRADMHAASGTRQNRPA